MGMVVTFSIVLGIMMVPVIVSGVVEVVMEEMLEMG